MKSRNVYVQPESKIQNPKSRFFEKQAWSCSPTVHVAESLKCNAGSIDNKFEAQIDYPRHRGVADPDISVHPSRCGD